MALLVLAVFGVLVVVLARFIVYVLAVFAVALAFDGYEYGRERLTARQAPGRLRATRNLLSIALPVPVRMALATGSRRLPLRGSHPC